MVLIDPDEDEMDSIKAEVIARKQEEHEREARIKQRLRAEKQREIDEQVSYDVEIATDCR